MRPRPLNPHRAPRRAAWLTAACLLALPAAAGAALPVGVYPLNPEALTRDEAADVEAVLVSGLHQAARGGTVVARDPPMLRPSCGRSPTDQCLAGLAGEGAVLVARARRQGVHVAISVALVNGRGKRTRWNTFLTTLSVQDARPCAQAIWMLENELFRPGAGPAPFVPPPAAPAPGVAAAGPTPPKPSLAPSLAPAPVPPAPPPTVASRPEAPPPPSGSWSTGKTAGAWIAGGGLAILAAGVVAGLQARSLDAELTGKFEDGTLTPADASAYDSVRSWSQAANVLFLAGGVATAGGATLFLLSPTVEPLAGGGVSVGLAGRF